jgi:hypothetical protein
MLATILLWLERLRRAMVPAVIIIGISIFARVLHEHYPIDQWLFWRIALAWLLALVFGLACLACGHATLIRILPRPQPILEHLVTSFALGVYEFFLAMFIGGLFRLYRPTFFIALPVCMLAIGAVPFYGYARRLTRHLRFYRARAARPPLFTYAALAFGVIAVVMMYIPILTAENVSFDARWAHLAISEHYVAARGIVRFPEGWYQGSSPHLAGTLYTWAFLMPKSDLLDRVMLAAHMEFIVFLWALAGVPALVRLLLPRRVFTRSSPAGTYRAAPPNPHTIGVTWVVRFLFPGVFLYDSSLAVGADHIASVFAIPTFALLLRALRDLSPRVCVALAIMISGTVLTKFTAAFLLIPAPAIAIAIRSFTLGVARLRAALRKSPDAAADTQRAPTTSRYAFLLGPAAAFAACLVLTTPFWLKNFIWYGNPVYPAFAEQFPSRPWSPAVAESYQIIFQKGLWKPETTWDGLIDSLKALFTFSIVPNNWQSFHRKVPVFGSLFTLFLFCLPLLRAPRRLWGLFLSVHVGIFAWYWTHHQDRYLQTIMPWMAAATAATLILIFRTGLAARAAASVLIALQLIWGGDVYFIPTHPYTRSSLKKAVDLFSSGFRKKLDERTKIFPPFYDIGKALPPRATVLIHENNPHLGIAAKSVNDSNGWQGGISYGELRTPREVYDKLKSFGVTHLLWNSQQSKGGDSYASDFMFFNFVTMYGQAPRRFGPMTLAQMPSAPPDDKDFKGAVIALTCRGTYAPGLYPLKAMTVPALGPRRAAFPRPIKRLPGPEESLAPLIDQASFALIQGGCPIGIPEQVRASYTLIARRKTIEFWARPVAAPAPSAPPGSKQPSAPPGSGAAPGDEVYPGDDDTDPDNARPGERLSPDPMGGERN